MNEKKIIDLMCMFAAEQYNFKSMNICLRENYPNLEFLKCQNSRNYFRNFVPWVLTNLPSIKTKLLKAIGKIYSQNYENVSTLDAGMSRDVRCVLLRRFGPDSIEYANSKKLVKISRADKGILIKRNKEILYSKLSNRLTFYNDDIITIIKEGIKISDPIHRALILLLVSGSRPCELFEKSRYSLSDIGPNWITQEFIAKRRTPIILSKPIIHFSAQEFLDELLMCRKDLILKYGTILSEHGFIRSTINTRANSIVKKLFDYQENVSVYTLRKIYAIMSYKLFSTLTKIYGNNPSHSIWINNILGHSIESLDAHKHYNNIDFQEGSNTLPIDTSKKDKYFSIITDHENPKITKTKMETRLKGLVPRSYVRLYYSTITQKNNCFYSKK